MTNIFDKVQTAKHLREREDLINLKDDWLIDTLMPSSQAGILVAPFKSFKSSLAMHMALMVSQGLPFFGYWNTIFTKHYRIAGLGKCCLFFCFSFNCFRTYWNERLLKLSVAFKA